MPHFINQRWIDGAGPALESTDPATGDMVWKGAAATGAEVDAAVDAARAAASGWAELPLGGRTEFLQKFAEQLKLNRPDLAETISREIGKPRWESLTEVEAMVGKIPVSIEAYNQRRNSVELEQGGATVATRFKPHGVVAVFGPFNFPGHLPNGHIVPALLAGNTVVFKPSELAPKVAEETVKCWEAANLPRGVLNLVQGARETGIALANHPGIDGLYFTGSVAVGMALSRTLAARPDKILALEMGGNNPLIVWDVAYPAAAAYLTIQSAYLTSGQRCTCARRLIVPIGSVGDAFLERLITMIRTIRVGPYTLNPEPFMGPVISDSAADKLLNAERQLVQRGAEVLVQMKPLSERHALLSPGLLDVTSVKEREDAEMFGPLLQVIRVNNFDEAIAEANRTEYGLAAGLFSDSKSKYDEFYRRIRAGVVNWNRPITGASGSLPFGGIGLSGNHRPSGFYAADYCSYPVASMEAPATLLPSQFPPGLSL